MRRLFLFVALLIAAPLQAQNIDQNQLQHSGQSSGECSIGGMRGGPNYLCEQSFLPGFETISGGGFYWHTPTPQFTFWPPTLIDGQLVWPTGETAPTQQIVEFSLRMTTEPVIGPYLWPNNQYPNVQPPIVLLTQTLTFGLVSGWVDAFWDPIAVTPGATYFLGIRILQAPFTAGPGFKQDPYAEGVPGNFVIKRAYESGAAYVGGTWMDYVGQETAQFDFTFRTFTSVPEPSTYAMMALGLLAVGAVVRRRRAKLPDE